MRCVLAFVGIVACLAGVALCDEDPKDLLKFLKVYSVTLPINRSGSYWNCRPRGCGALSPRLYNSPVPGGDLVVGWNDVNGTGRVSYLTKDSKKGYVLEKTVTIAGKNVRGMVALSDTSFGVLAWLPGYPYNQTKMFVQKWSAMKASGTPTMQWETQLECGSYPSGFDIGDSRMELDDNGDFFAYYHVHSTSGHEGDAYFRINSVSGEYKTIWGWGCSHSMSNLLSYHPILNKTLAICVTDCYPGTSGEFKENSIGGLYTEDRNLLQTMAGGCNGCIGGEVGMVAPIYEGGWAVIFSSHSEDLGKGQAACSSQYTQDIGVAIVDTEKKLASPVLWLTQTPESEIDPALARYGAFCGNGTCEKAGQKEQMFMIGWKQTQGGRIAFMDTTGLIRAGPYDVSNVQIDGKTTSVSWGGRDDTWRTLDDGSIAWLEAPDKAKDLLRIYVMEKGFELPDPDAGFTMIPCGTIIAAILMYFALILF